MSIRLLLDELERHPNKAALVDVLKEISQQTLSLQQVPSFENGELTNKTSRTPSMFPYIL